MGQEFPKPENPFVSYANENSKKYPIKFGVPQGSCLSPSFLNLSFNEKEILPPRKHKKSLIHG